VDHAEDSEVDSEVADVVEDAVEAVDADEVAARKKKNNGNP
jgi:hypothetical protein